MTPQDFAEYIQGSLDKWGIFGASTITTPGGLGFDGKPQEARNGSDTDQGPFQAAISNAKLFARETFDVFLAPAKSVQKISIAAADTTGRALDGAKRLTVEAARSVWGGITGVFTTVKVVLVLAVLVLVLYLLAQIKYVSTPARA